MTASQFITAALVLLVSGVAESVLGSEVPRAQPVGRYQKLWSQSPFTEKPEIEEGPPPESELDDYTLAGVSPVDGGYSVILINKKERDKRVHLLPGIANDTNFTVVGVRQDPISNKNTTVEIKTGAGKVGRVGYEEKYLALKTPGAQPAAAQRPANPAANTPKTPIPGVTNQQRGQTTSERKPRVRRVPTPPTNR